MRVLVKENDNVLSDLSFEDEIVNIGSEPSNAIHLPDYRVSPRQAIISPGENGAWFIENMDLTNQVRLNGHAIIERQQLQNGDEITLFDYLLKIYLDADLDHHVREEPHLTTEELAKVTKYPLPAGSVVKRQIDPLTLTTAQLELAARLSLEISTCRDIHELIDVSLRQLITIFAARVAWIGLRRKYEGELEIQAGRLPSGQSTGTNHLIELLQYRCVERAQHVCIRKVRDDPEIGSAMAVPLLGQYGTLGMIYVDHRIRHKRFQIPDLDLLTSLGAQIGAKADAIIKERQLRAAAVSATEVSVVHSIQAQLDPKHAPNWRHLQVSAYSRSGQDNPGDLYDVMKHPDSEVTAFLVGHVNGQGAMLALSLARLHSTFRVGFLHNDPPHALARALNWLMKDENDPTTVDAVFLLLDPKSGKLKYCRAGKIGAFIVNSRGEPRPLQGADAPPIGQVRNYEYISRVEQLAPGETLALYTRGVATPTNAAGERFGEKRFIELVCDGFCQPPAVTLQDVSHDLTAFFADGRHPDDITIVLLSRMPE